MNPERTPSPRWVAALALGGLYWAAARFAIHFRYPPDNVSTIWLPGGVLFSALAITPVRGWPLLLLAVLPAEILVQAELSKTWLHGVVFGLADFVLPVSAAGLLRAARIDPVVMRRFRDVVWFFAVLLGGSMLSATVGATVSRATSDSSEFDRVWRTWWAADMIGVLVTAPIAFSWRAERSTILGKGPERILLLVVAFLAAIWFFAGSSSVTPEVLFYVCGPILLWAAARFEAREVAVAGLAITFVAVNRIAAGAGPFSYTSLLVGDRIISFQLSMIVLLAVAYAAHALLSGRREAEQKLSSDKELLRALIDTVPGLIYSKDSTGHYTLMNRGAREFLGITTEADVAGKTVQDVMPADLARKLTDDDELILRGSETVVVREEVLTGAAGQPRLFHITKVPLRSSSASIDGLVGVGRDITDQRQMEREQLQNRKMEALGRLAGGVAHDFNNLLTVIIGYARMAIEDARKAPSRVPSSLGEVLLAGERAQALTRQMMAFSRGQISQPKVVDLAEVIRGLDSTLRGLLPSTIRLGIQTSGPVWIDIDPVKLEQVVLNLVTNASDAMPDGGEVTIEATALPAEGRALLTVRDAGCGMTEEVRAKAFEPFYTTKTEGRGTGLGLSTVYGIVQQAAGEITMESAPGQGTAVNLRFHLAHPPSTAAPPPVPSIPASPVRSTRTVLLVEDEASVRRLTRLMIESHGCKVIEAADAESALEAFYAQPASISAVVTDIGMPGRNGYELAKELASLRPGLPVLLVSGYANHVSVPETDGGPSFEILDKPFTADEIGSRLGKLFGDRS